MSKVYWAEVAQEEPDAPDSRVYWAKVDSAETGTASHVYWAEVESNESTTSPASGEGDLPEITTITLVGGGTIFGGADIDLTCRVTDQDGDPTPNVPGALLAVGIDVDVATAAALAAATDAAGEIVIRATGVGGGETDVTVSVGDLSATQMVAVRVVTTGALSVLTANLEEGTTGSATAVFRDQNGVPVQGRSVTWSSSNDSVIADPSGATTDNSGAVTVPLPTLAVGTTSLQAMCDGVVSNAVTVSVFAVSEPPVYSTSGVSQIIVNLESMLMRMQRAQPRYFSDADQRMIDPTDTSMSRIKANTERPVVWPSRELIIRNM